MKLELKVSDKIKENGFEYEVSEYRLGHYTVKTEEMKGGFVYRTMSVDKDRNEEYLPDIIYRQKEKKFVIQTTSYGTLDPVEIKNVIAGYEEAANAVEILTKELC